jgi:hypothetical protein
VVLGVVVVMVLVLEVVGGGVAEIETLTDGAGAVFILCFYKY